MGQDPVWQVRWGKGQRWFVCCLAACDGGVKGGKDDGMQSYSLVSFVDWQEHYSDVCTANLGYSDARDKFVYL